MGECGGIELRRLNIIEAFVVQKCSIFVRSLRALRTRRVSRLNVRTLRSRYPALISSTSSPGSDPTATAFPTSPRRERKLVLPTKLEPPVEVDTTSIELMLSSTDTVFGEEVWHGGGVAAQNQGESNIFTRTEEQVISGGTGGYRMHLACMGLQRNVRYFSIPCK